MRNSTKIGIALLLGLCLFLWMTNPYLGLAFAFFIVSTFLLSVVNVSKVVAYYNRKTGSSLKSCLIMAAISDNTPISRVELSDGHSIVPDYPRDTLEGKVSDLGFCVVFNFVKLITVMDKKPRYKLMFSRLQNDVGLDQDIFTAEFTQK